MRPCRQWKQGLKVGTCEKLTEAYTATFNEDYAIEYVTDRLVNEARLVRHAIVHNGGYETDDLRGYKHRYRVRDSYYRSGPRMF